MNRVILVGNVGQDPELKRTNGGTAVANTTLATSDGWGENKKTNWHNLVVWGKTAEAIAQYVTKGTKIVIEGRIDYRSWEGDDGVKHYKTEIIVDNWEFAGSKGDAPASDSPKQATPQQQQQAPADDPGDLPF